MADSDGYFCATARYLAYNMGSSGSDSHELRLVSLSPPLGQHSVRTLRLPDFQVHGLLCKDSELLMLGWDHVHSVSLLSANPRLHSKKLPSSGYRPAEFPKDPRTPNLGSVARPQALQLDASRPGLFLITRVTPSGRDCELRVVSTLEEVDREGRARTALVLYDGVKGDECG
jgi:hypothetical protein